MTRPYDGPIYPAPRLPGQVTGWVKSSRSEGSSSGMCCIHATTFDNGDVALWSNYDKTRGVIRFSQEAFAILVKSVVAGNADGFLGRETWTEALYIGDFTFSPHESGLIAITVTGCTGTVLATTDEVDLFVAGVKQGDFNTHAGISA